MTFQPGVSGNPDGKKKGTRNRSTRAREAEMAAISATLGRAIDYPLYPAIHLLRAIACHPKVTLDIKLDALKTIVRHEEPTLSATRSTSEVTISVAHLLTDERRRILQGYIENVPVEVEAEAVRVLGEDVA